jgi:myo-inositol-1(or 4)-monophosphatase
MVVGAVMVPPLDELYTAVLGRGALRNGRPVRASSTTDPALALIGTGFTYSAPARVDQAEVVARLIGAVRDIRRLGSAAVDLCMVACGRLDAYFERHLNSWDAAAGELIAREAGAITSDFSGGDPRPGELFVAAPGLHAALLTELRSALEPT